MRFDRKKLGQLGEDLAARILEKEGYKILTRNFRTKVGELDIVAQQKDWLVFIEVKCRFPGQFASPEEAITPTKINHIIKAGDYYLLLKPTNLSGPRIDVVAIEFDEAGVVKRQEIIRNITG